LRRSRIGSLYYLLFQGLPCSPPPSSPN
jgi:hypothetical protein